MLLFHISCVLLSAALSKHARVVPAWWDCAIVHWNQHNAWLCTAQSCSQALVALLLCKDKSHEPGVVIFFITKAYFAIQCRLFIPNNYVKSIHLLLSWFSELLNTVIFSLKLKRMICFRYLHKYGQTGTLEWSCCTRMSFLLRFCFLQFISGSCWFLSAVLEEDSSSDQSLNCILL